LKNSLKVYFSLLKYFKKIMVKEYFLKVFFIIKIIFSNINLIFFKNILVTVDF